MDHDDPFFKKLLDNLAEGVYFVDLERRIKYWNRGAERLTDYAAGEVVGRACADNFLVHTDISGCELCAAETCPAAIAMRTGQTVEERVFMRHKNGYRVPVEVKVEPIRDAGGAVVGAVETFHDASGAIAAEQELTRLERAALLDPLTEVGNRRFCEIELQRRCDEFARFGWSFGVIFADVDNFKEINDTHGHKTGDHVLRMVAKTLANTVRSFDVIGRWGGEEFLLQLKSIAADELGAITERLRRLVEGSALPLGERHLQVTISAGATVVRPEDTPETIVARADTLMYAAKAAGRNHVIVG